MTSKSIDRRNIAKGAAWTLPVIAIAAAAPSLAASGSPAPPTGHADKCPGQSDVPGDWPKQGYRLVMHGIDDTPIIASITQNNGKVPDVVAGPTPLSPGSWEWVLDATSSPSSLTVTIVGYPPVVIPASPHCTER